METPVGRCPLPWYWDGPRPASLPCREPLAAWQDPGFSRILSPMSLPGSAVLAAALLLRGVAQDPPAPAARAAPGGLMDDPSTRPAVGPAFHTLVGAHAANGDFSGVLLVTRHGERVVEVHDGRAGPASEEPIAADSRFLVASVTKTFTAAAIALLEKDGKLAITDGLDQYLPDFAHAGKIKLWHLLAHQSGLANPDYDSIATRNVTPDELLALIGSQPLRFEPGSDSSYSNAGYIALARVVERVSGQPFGEFLAQRVFAPLGMQDCGTLASGASVPHLAEGRIPGVGTALLRPQPRDPSALFGSGNVYATAADLDRWLTAVDRHELFDITQQPYPFGWGQRTWFDKAVLVQSGMTNGYGSIILSMPADELHIVALLNTQSGFTGDEGESLLGLVLGHPVTPPPPRGAPPTVPRETLERLAGLWLWGEGRTPMHLQTDGRVLSLRWGDSASVVPLTPLGKAEFLDRTSFGRVRFEGDSLVWTQQGRDTPGVRATEPAAR
jgi:D-alanyl-D-alanine carboxypeptidase